MSGKQRKGFLFDPPTIKKPEEITPLRRQELEASAELLKTVEIPRRHSKHKPWRKPCAHNTTVFLHGKNWTKHGRILAERIREGLHAGEPDDS